MKTTISTFLLMALALIAQASEEGPVAFTSFTIESKEISTSGKIVVTGKQDDGMFLTELKVTAFGKEYSISKDKLAGLSIGFTYGIQITSEPGYKEVGGRTIYVRIHRGGFPVASRYWLLLTIKEDGSIKVEELKKNPTSVSSESR